MDDICCVISICGWIDFNGVVFGRYLHSIFKCAFSMLTLIKSRLYLPDLSTHPGRLWRQCLSSDCSPNNRLTRFVVIFIAVFSGERASFPGQISYVFSQIVNHFSFFFVRTSLWHFFPVREGRILSRHWLALSNTRCWEPDGLMWRYISKDLLL